jgi:hypothetical protein
MVELDEENAAELTIDMTLALRLVWFTRPFLADFAMRGVAISFLMRASVAWFGSLLGFPHRSHAQYRMSSFDQACEQDRTATRMDLGYKRVVWRQTQAGVLRLGAQP